MHRIDLDTDLLRCFVAVADLGGFTAAGTAVGRTQSAVSLKIKKLETQLGAQLFQRTSRSLALTPDGELLLGYARRLLDLNDETVQRLTGPEARGTLKLGIADYFVPLHLPDLLARFSRLHPRLHLEIHTGLGLDLIPRFERAELDLVVAGREPHLGGGEVILREPLVWAAGAAFRPEGEAPLPLAALPHPCSHRSAGIAALETIGRPWRLVYTSSSIAGIQAALRAGLGIAVLPASALGPDLRQLGASENLPGLPENEIAVFDDAAKRDPQRAAFIAFLTEQVRQLPTIKSAA